MLKFFFWCFLIANGILFALQRGYLEQWISEGREPNRQIRQFNADQVKLISAAAASNTTAAAPTTAKTEVKPEIAACIEVGNFSPPDATRFETQLAGLSLGDRLSRYAVEDSPSHMVYIAPQGSKESADKKAGELRRLGINDFYIIQDTSDLRWGISLGIFKTDAAAQTYLASLLQKGVHSAHISARPAKGGKVAFQLRGIDQPTKNALDKIKTDFPSQELTNCKTFTNGEH